MENRSKRASSWFSVWFWDILKYAEICWISIYIYIHIYIHTHESICQAIGADSAEARVPSLKLLLISYGPALTHLKSLVWGILSCFWFILHTFQNYRSQIFWVVWQLNALRNILIVFGCQLAFVCFCYKWKVKRRVRQAPKISRRWHGLLCMQKAHPNEFNQLSKIANKNNELSWLLAVLPIHREP